MFDEVNYLLKGRMSESRIDYYDIKLKYQWSGVFFLYDK